VNYKFSILTAHIGTQSRLSQQFKRVTM